MTLTAQTDRTLVLAGSESVRHVMVTFTAPAAVRAGSRLPLNLSLVIDRSGSMAGHKLALARTAVVQSLRMLSPADRFSVVCYDHEVEVLVSSTLASQAAVADAIERVQGLQGRGTTNLSGGWLKGCEQIAGNQQSDQIARCILLSDGLANAGISDAGELARHAQALRERGIATSCLGIGADYDERLLQGLALSGRGNFYHVGNAEQIPDLLTSELGEALQVVARDASITLRPTTGISILTLNRFPLSIDGPRTCLRLGDLASCQEVSAVFELTFPAGRIGDRASVLFGLADADGALACAETDIVWTFADAAANAAEASNPAVDRAVAMLLAAAASADALELNRAGRFDEAGARVRTTADRIGAYGDADLEVRSLVAELTEKGWMYARPISPAAMKAGFATAHHGTRMRTADGRARKRSDA